MTLGDARFWAGLAVAFALAVPALPVQWLLDRYYHAGRWLVGRVMG
jgi:hypothetical protein